MRYLLFLCIHLPFNALAQAKTKLPDDSAGPGIHFTAGLSWSQILTKAKAERKYVFVDCYTSWCGPCKEMENKVYPLKEAGDLYNAGFICVKFQMDTSQKDMIDVKERYADARYVGRTYKVDAYPTFLFFTPDGKIIDRDKGERNVADFLTLGAEVLHSKRDYYALLQAYNQGRCAQSDMMYLAQKGLLLGDTITAYAIAKECILLMPKTDLFEKANIQFLHDFTKSSNSVGFNLFYNHTARVNKIMNDDLYCQRVIWGILYREFVAPSLEQTNRKQSDTPDWANIGTAIGRKFNRYYSESVIILSKCTWAYSHQMWTLYARCSMLYEEKFASRTSRGFWAAGELNKSAWFGFQYCKDSVELTRALNLSAKAVLIYPTANYMDTYGNLLYKLGRSDEALIWEKTAAQLDPKDENIKDNLAKMEKGLPTWQLLQ